MTTKKMKNKAGAVRRRVVVYGVLALACTAIIMAPQHGPLRELLLYGGVGLIALTGLGILVVWLRTPNPDAAMFSELEKYHGQPVRRAVVVEDEDNGWADDEDDEDKEDWFMAYYLYYDIIH